MRLYNNQIRYTCFLCHYYHNILKNKSINERFFHLLYQRTLYLDYSSFHLLLILMFLKALYESILSTLYIIQIYCIKNINK